MKSPLRVHPRNPPFLIRLAIVLGVATQKTLKAKKGGMLLFRALDGARNEGRQGQKMKKFWKKFSKILIANISASEPSIKKILKWFEEMGYPIISKQLDYF